MLARSYSSVRRLSGGQILPPRRRLRGLGATPSSTPQIVGTVASTAVTAASIIPSALPALIGATAATGVGLIAAPIIAIIAGIFGSHAAAVAQQANTLNTAVPAFYTSLQAIVAAANNGQISVQTALSYIDTAVSTYYAQVGAIIKKGQNCTINSDCSAPGGSDAGDVDFSPCNGPCSMGCDFIEPAACQAKQLLSGSGGSVALYVPTGNSAGFNGLQPITVTYTPQQPAASPASVTTTNSSPVNAVAADVQAVTGIDPAVLIAGLLGGLVLVKVIL